MNWTVSRRIVTGYALALLLIAAVAAIGIWSLGRTADEYSSAFEVERGVVLPARDAVAASRSANIAFLRYLVDEQQAFRSARDSAITAARTELNTLVQRDASAGTSWREAQQLLDQWAQQSASSQEAATANQTDVALSQRQAAQQTRERFESVMAGAIDELQVRTDTTLAIAETTREASESAIYIALGLALVLMIVSAYLLNRAISRPLQDTSNVLAASAAEILATTTEQASGATESLAAVTQTAATVDEVVQTAEQATERARAVAASAQRAADIGRQGRQAVEQSGAAMEQVRVQVNSIGNSILELAEQAQAIGEIITTVNDLAEQTNLLALNAAIEAARAGEQGRGFSVVAGEVRGLAEQSKNSTVRVRQILGEIQRATSAAVMATEQGNKQVEEGSRQVKEAGETIRQLADAIQAAAQAAAQISASANQQATGMTQIKQAVGSIQQASQQNLAATKQAESAAQELNRMGGQLQALVGTEIRRPSAA